VYQALVEAAARRDARVGDMTSQPNQNGLPRGRPFEKQDCAEDYIMPALVPLLAGLLEANSCMVSRMYLCGFTGVSWMRTS
jgi:hypothetical protein